MPSSSVKPCTALPVSRSSAPAMAAFVVSRTVATIAPVGVLAWAASRAGVYGAASRAVAAIGTAARALAIQRRITALELLTVTICMVSPAWQAREWTSLHGVSCCNLWRGTADYKRSRRSLSHFAGGYAIVSVMSGISRRDFITSAAATVAAVPLLPRLGGAAPVGGDVPRPLVRPFDVSRVRLRAGLFLDDTQVARRHMESLDPDRLLHMFRVTAGLPSNAEPLGGWEAPDNELRGHYTGHYLSACALMGASQDNATLRTRGLRMVDALAQCQRAIGTGYLSAFPEELFDRLRAGRQVWAPFYTVHKIMAGLLDTYTLSGYAPALEVLKGMVRWTGGWTQPLGDEAMARVLEREYG